MRSERLVGAKVDFAIMFGFISIISVMPAISAHAQTDRFNGTYAGTQTLEDAGPVANYSQCLKGPFKRRLVIKDGAATYVFNPTYQGQVTGTVSADGDVVAGASEPSGGVAFSGKIQGDDFTGEVWSLYCTYSLQLKRAP
jgi:hypothetical protein